MKGGFGAAKTRVEPAEAAEEERAVESDSHHTKPERLPQVQPARWFREGGESCHRAARGETAGGGEGAAGGRASVPASERT